MLSSCLIGQLTDPPILFLHGFLGVKEDWEDLLSEFKAPYACYCLDLPGHGDSVFRKEAVESVLDTMDYLSISSCHLVGYSMGGRLALQLKKAMPERFNKVIVMGAHPGILDPQERQRRYQEDLEWIHKLERQPLSEFLKLWYAQPLFNTLHENPALLSQIFARRQKGNPLQMAAFLRHFSIGQQAPLTEFSQETFFMYGEKDLKYRSFYSKFISSEKLIEIKRSGHVVHLENPKECAEKLRDILKR